MVMYYGLTGLLLPVFLPPGHLPPTNSKAKLNLACIIGGKSRFYLKYSKKKCFSLNIIIVEKISCDLNIKLVSS